MDDTKVKGRYTSASIISDFVTAIIERQKEQSRITSPDS
jgi:hypothetical protein